jgi:hypothetical protein
MIKRWIKVNDDNKNRVMVEICSNLYYNNRMDEKSAAASKNIRFYISYVLILGKE